MRNLARLAISGLKNVAPSAAQRLSNLRPRYPIVNVPRKLRNTGPRRLVLHVGAHKTGTSSLQTVLRRNGDQLAQQGVFAFARHIPRTSRHMRSGGYGAYVAQLRSIHQAMRKAPVGSNEQKAAARRFADLIEKFAGGAPTIVISDESLLGPRVRNSKGLYSDAEKQLRAIMDAFPDRTVSVLLYVRDQIGYVEGSYLQSLKEGSTTLSFHRYLKKHVALDKLSWVRLAERIASVVGDEALAVERFERISERGFVPFAQRFIDHFADSSLLNIKDVQANTSFSALGVELALAIRRHVSRTRWKKYGRLLSTDFIRQKGQERPRLFSEEQKSHLKKVYEGDCEAAEALYSRRNHPAVSP